MDRQKQVGAISGQPSFKPLVKPSGVNLEDVLACISCSPALEKINVGLRAIIRVAKVGHQGQRVVNVAVIVVVRKVSGIHGFLRTRCIIRCNV